MIKRTMGRALLTLLVVTGLAGTVEDHSLSKHDRKVALNLMKETKSDLFNSVKGLSDAQLNFKTAPDRWSVRECVYHIAGAETFLWTLFESAMKAPENPEKRVEIKVTDQQMITNTENRATRFQAPEPIQPKNTGYASVDEALDDFRNTRMNHIRYMRTSTEDLRNHVVQLPFGWIDCYQLYLMIGAHSNRHTQQLNEVKASPGFPK